MIGLTLKLGHSKMGHEEGLEKAGGGNLDKLIEKIKTRYPDFNFDIPPPPDTKCKQEYDCKGLRNITYSDQERNIFCGRRYKQTSESNPYSWEYKECHAMLLKKQQGMDEIELPF